MSLNQSWDFYHQQQQYQQQHQLQHQHQHQHQHYPAQQQRQPAVYEPSRLASPFESELSAPDLDFDFDTHFHHQHHSLSSSPISTQSVPSQYSASPLSTFDSISTAHEGSLFESSSQSSQAPADSASLFLTNTGPMQTESWLPNGQLTPRSVGRFAHQRDSSRSSMGSNGPASPYSQNISHPQIAVNDSAGDGFHTLSGADELNYQLAAKSFPGVTHDNFYTTLPATYGSNNGSGMAPYPYVATIPKQRRNDGGLLAPSERPIGSGRSQPASVASSIASDSPITPAGEPEEDRRRNTGEIDYSDHLSEPSSPFSDEAAMHTVPKLARTMTDAYSDELYSPDFTIASSTSGQAPMSPTNDLFAQRLQAANTQHLSAVSHSPVSATSRDRSPFRQGSPLAPMPMHDFRSAMGPSQMRFPSAQQMREQNKAMQDAQAVQQHITRAANTSTPQTISPKDAMLEFHEPDGDANFPLFPQHSANNGFNADTMNKTTAAPQTHPAFDTGAFNKYLTSASIQIPQQYPFIAQPRQQSAVPSASNKESVPTTRRGSADTAATESAYATPRRPADTTADGGTYTCTYHGCTMRFETPALLQKHKREGHRAAHGLNATRRPESMGMGTSLLNTQAGPHRCDRINPSTGKACNTVFSRPYDLTRHEDTIHNARKQKVRCDMCTDEKTFSRADALTRHYRVCHPDVEFPGKHRRRGGHSV